MRVFRILFIVKSIFQGEFTNIYVSKTKPDFYHQWCWCLCFIHNLYTLHNLFLFRRQFVVWLFDSCAYQKIYKIIYIVCQFKRFSSILLRKFVCFFISSNERTSNPRYMPMFGEYKYLSHEKWFRVIKVEV